MKTTFAAHYDGTCPQCGGRIRRGEQVCWYEFVLVHADCAQNQPDANSRQDLAHRCPACRLTRPCDCEDPDD